jgi:hypothetical protein
VADSLFVEGRLSRVIRSVDETASEIEAICGTLSSASRFTTYRDVLRRTLDPGISDDELPLLFESIGQWQQLRLSSTVWSLMDRALLTNKLRKIVAGSHLPPVNPDHDDPRNTLGELVAAAVMHSQGMDVRITEEEDLSVVVPPLALGGPAYKVAVECKRPANQQGFDRAVRDVRHQLRSRFGAGYEHAMPVFVVDRLVPIYRTPVTIDPEDHFNQGMDDLMNDTIGTLKKIVVKRRRRLDPRTTVISVLYTCVAVERGKQRFFSKTKLMTVPIEPASEAAIVMLKRFARAQPERPLREFS